MTPLAVMTAPSSCPGKCVYCPTYAGAPQSYTPESPAVLRARRFAYDARQQVAARLNTFAEMGHPTDKIELIIMGGTFLAQPFDYQYGFIKDCYDALNGVVSASLDEAKKLNETAHHRCTGLCIETRPDWCGPAEIERMLEFGATRVELGVQTLDDDIFRLVRRGHGVVEVVRDPGGTAVGERIRGLLLDARRYAHGKVLQDIDENLPPESVRHFMIEPVLRTVLDAYWRRDPADYARLLRLAASLAPDEPAIRQL